MLGGQPKRVSEEDWSARFFVHQNRFNDFVSDNVLSMESFRRRDDSEFLRYLASEVINIH